VLREDSGFLKNCKLDGKNLRKARVSLEQQMERLTDAYLANVLQLEEYKRRRLELEQRLSVIAEQKRQLEANVGHHDQPGFHGPIDRSVLPARAARDQ